MANTSNMAMLALNGLTVECETGHETAELKLTINPEGFISLELPDGWVASLKEDNGSFVTVFYCPEHAPSA